MNPKDVLAFLTGAEQDGVFNALSQLRQRWGAHLTAVQLTALPEILDADVFFTSTVWADAVTEARAAAAQQKEGLVRRLESLAGPPVEYRSIEAAPASAERLAAQHALYCDLVVMERPSLEMGVTAMEGALMGSGRPTLLIPPEWGQDRIGRTVMVAWTPTREAARALSDAGPFLAEAEAIKVLTVELEEPACGPDVAAHLARRGHRVELMEAACMGRSVEDCILENARLSGADLLVMGAYGHSRLQQFVFGGVSRTLTAKAPLPVLLTH